MSTDRILRSSIAARSAVAGLTIGLSALVGLTLWSNESTSRAVTEVRRLEDVSSHWQAVFLQVSVEFEALNDYVRSGTQLGREPLMSTSGSADPQLRWLAERGGAQEKPWALSLRQSYGAYTYTVRQLLEAGDQGDNAAVTLYADQAGLSASGLRKQSMASVARKQFELTVHLAQVEHRNRMQKAAATVIGLIDCLLLALSAGLLLSHQKRLRLTARESERLAVALSSEKSLLAEVISSIPHLVYWKDERSRYADCNQAFLAARGVRWAELIGRTEQELDGPVSELGAVLAALEAPALGVGHATVDHTVTISGPDGRTRTLLLSVLPHRSADGAITGTIGVGADVSQITALERQLAQASRLESIGQLAAGIAHEINTPVQFVTHNVQFVADALEPVVEGLHRVALLAGRPGEASGQPDQSVMGGPADLPERLRAVLDRIDVEFVADEVPDALTQSLEGLTRVTQIVRAMKDFSHPGGGRSDCDLNRAVESTVQVSRNEWKTIAEVELDLDPQVGQVPCFESEIKQVLLNIIVNAAQAIGSARSSDAGNASGSGMGRIRVATRREDAVVRITVQDDGPGMDLLTQQRVFDPFFTTKGVGQGTGQGLSIARSIIVNKHGGTIEVRSSPGAGATFEITLPLHACEADASPAAVTA